MVAYTALIDLVFRRTGGSAWILSVTTLITMGGVGLLGPIGGVIADRGDRKRAMIGSDLVGAAMFVALAFSGPVWLILVVAFLSAAAATPFRAGSTAAIPNLVQDEALIARANGRLAIGSNLGIMLGPAIGGLLVAWVGAGPAFVLNAASFVVSAGLIWSIRAPFKSDADSATSSVGRSGAFAGFRFIRHDRVMLVVTLATMVLLLGLGVGIVADRPVADAFSTGSVGFGVMLGLYGAGAVGGAWVASRLTAATEPAGLVAGLGLAGAAGLGIGLAPAFGVVLAFNVVWGVGDAVATVARPGILQRRTPDEVRGRVAAAYEFAANLALMCGFIAAAPAIAVVGAQGAYAVGGVAAIAAALLAATVVSAARRNAVS